MILCMSCVECFGQEPEIHWRDTLLLRAVTLDSVPTEAVLILSVAIASFCGITGDSNEKKAASSES
jgi:hypothetical protein